MVKRKKDGSRGRRTANNILAVLNKAAWARDPGRHPRAAEGERDPDRRILRMLAGRGEGVPKTPELHLNHA